MENDKLRSHFRKRFYDSRVEANDLEWQDIETNLKSKSASKTYFLGVNQIKWMSIAASVLLIGALFAYNLIDGKNEEIPATRLPSISENTDTPEPQAPNEDNFETLPPSQKTSTKEPEPDEILTSELTQSNESNKIKENDSEDKMTRTQVEDVASLVGIREVSFNNINLVKTETPDFKETGIGGYVPVDMKPDNHSFNSVNNKFLTERVEDSFLAMNRLSFSIRPVQKYSTFTPNRNDIVYIPGLNSVSFISENRLGIHSSFSVQFSLNVKWNLVVGGSYLHQRNYFEYESINPFNLQSNVSEVNAGSNHVGFSAGVERAAPFLTSYNPAVHFNVEYLKGMDSSENALGDILSVDVGYSATLMEANRVEFRIKPVISYSFLETKNAQFSSKPYWLGIQFSVNRNFK